jgi:hypothetical protein
LETGRTFAGGWRRAGDFVQTVALEGRGDEPVELVISS